MVDTTLESWDIILLHKKILVNTCWLYESIFLLWIFLEIGENGNFFIFSIGSRVNKSQQVLTKKIFVEKYGIWAFYIRVEHYFITLITHSMISLRFAYFLRQNLSEKRWKFFFVKNSARQHLLTKCKLCWWKHMGWAPLTL